MSQTNLPMPTWKEHSRIVIILCLLLAVFFPEVVFLGKTFKITTANPQALPSGPYGQKNNIPPRFFPIYTNDVSLNEEPVLEFIKRSLRQGTLPLWNPHLGCGYPLIGHLHVGLFYPLNLIYYLLPNRYAWDFLIFARMFLGGLFAFYFMRTLRFPFIPSLATAVMFMLSRPMVVLQSWMVNVDLLIPLVLLAVEKFIQKPRLPEMCFVAGAVALSMFAGHPEHLVLLHTVAVSYFVFRVLNSDPDSRPPLRQSTLRLAGAYALGVGLASIVLFPFLYNWIIEFWHAHPKNMGAFSELAGMRKFSLSVLFPLYFQKVPLDFQFEPAGWWGAVGILPVGLAFVGLFFKDRTKLNWFFFCIALLIFIKVLTHSPLDALIGRVPPFCFIRFSNHTGHLFAFVLAVSSGMAIHNILCERPASRKFLVFAVFCWLLLGVNLFLDRAAPYFKNALDTSIVSFIIILSFLICLVLKEKNRLSMSALSVIMLVVISAELLCYVPRGRVNKFDSFPQVPYIDLIKASVPRERAYGIFWALYPNTSAAYQIDDMGLYEGLLLKRFVNYVNTFVLPGHYLKNFNRTAFWVFPFTELPWAKPYLNLLNLRYIVGPNPLPSSKKLPLIKSLTLQKPLYSNEVNVYVNSNAMPRAFIVHRATFEPDNAKAVAKFKNHRNFLQMWALLNHAPEQDIVEQLTPSPVMDNSSVVIERYSPNEVTLRADMRNPGLVVLGDAYHSDWKAFVDGKPMKIFITDFLIRSVFVPKGAHQIRYVFKPASFYLGAMVSLVSLVLLVLFWGMGRKQSRLTAE